MASLYIVDLPYLYTLMDWLEHPSAPTQQITWSYTMMMRLNWAVTLFFWAALWCVKLSLLLFFRRVISQIRHWMRAWWFILGFTVITFLGCVISQITSCDSPKDFTVLGKCASARNQRAQVISLYYSYAADVLTDMLSLYPSYTAKVFCLLTLPSHGPSTTHRSCPTPSNSRQVDLGLPFRRHVDRDRCQYRQSLSHLRQNRHRHAQPSLAWSLGSYRRHGRYVFLLTHIFAVPLLRPTAIVVGCIPVISQIFRTSKEISSASSGRAAQPMKQYEGSDVHTGNTSAKTTVEYGRRSPERSRRISTTGHPLDEGLRRVRSRTEIVSPWIQEVDWFPNADILLSLSVQSLMMVLVLRWEEMDDEVPFPVVILHDPGWLFGALRQIDSWRLLFLLLAILE